MASGFGSNLIDLSTFVGSEVPPGSTRGYGLTCEWPGPDSGVPERGIEQIDERGCYLRSENGRIKDGREFTLAQ
jgi:hypothetical protein